jgi:DME family drug/metabolite transporter
MKTNYLKGLIFSILSVLAFASNEVLGTLGLRSGASTITLLSVRALIAIILLGGTILIWKKQTLKIEKKDIWRIILPGLILMGEMLTFWAGLKILTQLSIIMCLYYLGPLWAVIASSLLIRKLPQRNIIYAIFMAILGVALVSQFIPNLTVNFDLKGGLIMVTSGFLWAMYFLSSQYAVKKYHALPVTLYTFGIVFIITLFLQNPLITISQLSVDTLKYLVAMGIFTTYLAYLFLVLAVSVNKAVKSNTLDVMAGVLSVSLGILVLGQRLTFLQALGVVSVLSVTYILKDRKRIKHE